MPAKKKIGGKKVQNQGPREGAMARGSRSSNRGGVAMGVLNQNAEVVERGIPGFKSVSHRARLFYYDVATITTGAGSAGTRVYTTNGCYDPDVTGGGHQPMAFDQMMLSFEHYVCLKSNISVSFKNTSTTNTMSVAVSLNASATPVTAYGMLVENGVIARKRVGMYPYGGCMGQIGLSCDVAKFGDVRNLLDNPEYQGTIAANPTEQSYFHISCWNPDSVSSVDCLVEIAIVYDVVFREPRKNSPSINAALRSMIIEEKKEVRPSEGLFERAEGRMDADEFGLRYRDAKREYKLGPSGAGSILYTRLFDSSALDKTTTPWVATDCRECMAFYAETFMAKLMPGRVSSLVECQTCKIR